MTERDRPGIAEAERAEAWAISDLLEDTDAFLDDLRDSNERLDAHRRRFARLVVEQADALRGVNASLSREVDQLTRLQSLARFFTAPGPEESFEDRLAEACGRALGGLGAAVARRSEAGWAPHGRWRMSRRNALGVVPGPEEPSDRIRSRPSTRKGTRGWWIPLGPPDPGSTGLAVLLRAGRQATDAPGGSFVDSVRTLVAEGLQTHAATKALLSRESQSDRILRTLKGGLLKLDPEGRVAFTNPAFADILETDVDELEGRRVEEVFPRDAHVREVLHVVAEGGALDETETHVTTRRGRRVAVSLRASRLTEGTGPGGVLILLSDLSRRKAVEEEFRKTDRLAALGRLSAGVAHEIRNPLAGIRTTAEVLRNRLESDETLVQFADVILEEAGRLDRIVESLLQFAKPPEPRRVPVAMGALLDRARQLAAGRAADRGVTIRVAADEDLPQPAVDRDQILQVLLNLLLNGIEATPAGGEVNTRAEIETRAGRDEIRLVVEDGGPGVPASIRERIFDPFFTTKPGGTGLGLSISRNILRRHGGFLRLESEPGRPTRAVVVLPLERAADTGRHGDRPWPTS